MTTSITTFAVRMPQVAGGMLPIVLIRFDPSTFDPVQFAAEDIVCPPNVQRSIVKRQAEFHYGRLAARRAMQAAMMPPAQIAIGAAREPLWPAGVVGSITHSGGLAAASVLRSPPHSGLGIDIEHIATEAQQTALLKTTITPDEVECLRGAGAALPFATLLTIAFSAKESLFKGAYATVQRYFDLDVAQVSAIDPAQSAIELTLQETLGPGLDRGQRHALRYGMLDPGTVITAFVR